MRQLPVKARPHCRRPSPLGNVPLVTLVEEIKARHKEVIILGIMPKGRVNVITKINEEKGLLLSIVHKLLANLMVRKR